MSATSIDGLPTLGFGARDRCATLGRMIAEAAVAPVLERYEPVIGIEVHCQLRTESKMFCACSTAYDGARPNSHVCPVCLGLPGALPAINKRAVELVLATGAALGADHARGNPLGPEELLLSRTCPRATRSASTTCRSRLPGR